MMTNAYICKTVISVGHGLIRSAGIAKLGGGGGCNCGCSETVP